MTGNLGTSGGRVEMSLEGTRAGGKRDDERLYYGHVIYLYAWRGQVSVSPAGKLAFSTLEASKHSSGLDVRIIFNLKFKKVHYQQAPKSLVHA
jgi:hypothetical protein